MRNDRLPIIIVTIYLIVFAIFCNINISPAWPYLMFSLSPVLLGWMVYCILKYGKFKGKELKKGEEWGYGDYKKK